MTELFIQYMAPIMFASLVIFLLLGYPAAFSLAANGLIFALIGIELGLFRPDFLQALPESHEPGASVGIGVGIVTAHHGGKPPHALGLLRIANGQVAAAPPSVAKNFRRSMWLAM